MTCRTLLSPGIHALGSMLLLSALAVGQTGLAGSAIPAQGMGNSPGISFPIPGSVPAAVAPVSPPLANPVTSGTVPVFFGSDGPNTIIINNIVPAPEPGKAVVVPDQPAASPVVIEREGDQWVRRRLASGAPVQRSPQTESEPQLLPARANQPLPETTLIFRDGHRETVGTYMIFAGALYHSTPAWAPQQQVKLSILDLPATESVNRRRGVVFRIPNSPNEVVTRP